MQPEESTVRARLNEHFQRWLGAVPKPNSSRFIVRSLQDQPGWDGKVRPIQGVTGPEGSVLAVSPRYADLFANANIEDVFIDAASFDSHARLEVRFGGPVSFGLPIFRWSERAADLPEIGEWVDVDDPRLPAWLRPFNGGVLAAFDTNDSYMAGIGLKRHNDLAREISVGTEPEHRGQGYATQLVAQAARRIIAEGGVPIYQHGGANEASARAAIAAGFPDRGWHMLEIHPGAAGNVRG